MYKKVKGNILGFGNVNVSLFGLLNSLVLDLIL